MVGPTDNVARRAAEMFHAGEARPLSAAVDAAQAELGGGAVPSMATVRRHLEALRQASIGFDQWARDRARRLTAIDELLQTLAYVEPNAVCYVSGRAAEGLVDDTGPAKVRVVGDVPAPIVLDELEAQGFPPFEVSSQRSALGSVPVAHVEDRWLSVDLLFLPNHALAHEARSVVDGRPIAMVDEVGFQELLESLTAEG